MNQKQLQIFMNLTKTLNYRKTAEQLFVSQGTVTFQIRNLEEELNVKLFHRDHHSVRLTAEGLIFSDYACKILDLMDQAAKDLSISTSEYTGILDIGFCIDTNKAGITDLVRTFMDTHSSIMVNLIGDNPGILFDRLLADQCSLIITPYYKKLDDPVFSYYGIGRYKQMAAFHTDHAFNNKASLSFSDFAGENIIGVSNPDNILDFTDEFLSSLKNQGIEPHVIAYTDNIDAVLLMLEANLGVTVIPDYFSERLSGNTRIHTAKIDEPLKGANLVAVWKKDNKSKELRQFLNLLKSRFPV